MNDSALRAHLEASLRSQSLFYVVLSRPLEKGAEVLKITGRPLHIKGGDCFQLTTHFKHKVTHANCQLHELLDWLWPQIGKCFREAVFFTAEADFHVLLNKRSEWTVLNKKPTRQSGLQGHNRLKSHVIEKGAAVPFLVELGVMKPDGSLVPKMAHKFKQINRFVEIIADVVPSLCPETPLKIVDFGCGKSYLTFAVYHYLHHIQQRDVEIVGLDLKADVVSTCQALAERLGYTGLRFQVGDINTHVASSKIDMVISLHACDTATDAALEKAVGWQADVILCVPCCQHELYAQVNNPLLSPLLKHGILRERFAALVTDAARAQLLDIAGYRTQVMEFIDMEHTPKNLLIRAIRATNKPDPSAALEAYHAFVNFLAVTPSLGRRLL